MLSRLARTFFLGLPTLLIVACTPSAPVGPPVAPAPAPAKVACASAAECEQRASARLEAVRHDPAALTAFLRRFPKGGDLHNHLAGAVYAESYIGWAREDGLRLDPTLGLVSASKCGSIVCSDLPAPADARFDAVVRAWSMKDFQPGAESGHDHFFAAFSRFGLVSHEGKREGAMLAETMVRAAEDGAIYLEVLVTATRPLASEIAKAAGAVDPKDLKAFEQKLHADARWGELVKSSRDTLRALDRSAREILHCGSPAAAPACSLTVRYLGQVGRTAPAPVIFTEMLATFEISREEPTLAGVNLVSPEDDATALRDYDLQMSILGFLGAEYRGKSPIRVTLHAGELIPAIVPKDHPEYLQAHIRNAVEVAHAERIGHGVDVLGERDAPGLLAEMRARAVTVEICLTSNAVILGVSGAAHPLSAYLRAGVPVTLATDDAGVARSSLTGEYARAVTDQGVTYPQLKAMARRSLIAAFVPGESLWADPTTGRAADACLGHEGRDPMGLAPPSDVCGTFVASSPRAQLQWRLEGQLAAFERE